MSSVSTQIYTERKQVCHSFTLYLPDGMNAWSFSLIIELLKFSKALLFLQYNNIRYYFCLQEHILVNMGVG